MPKGQSKNSCVHQASYILYEGLRHTVRLWLNVKFVFANPVHLGKKFFVLALEQEDCTITESPFCTFKNKT